MRRKPRWRSVIILLLCFIVFPVLAQRNSGPEGELKLKAQTHFDNSEYAEAMQLFSQLLSLHPSSADYNYHYGASLLFGDADKEKSLRHLNYAIGKADVPDEVHFYLGKAYHLNYQFADALEQYQTYARKTDSRRKGKIDVNLAIRQCENGLKLLSNIKDVTVLKRVETSANEFFRNYDLSDIGGRILVCPEELLTKYDLKTGERFLMFFPGKTSTVFFSSYGSDGRNGRDIYRAVRLPNGNWSKPIAMSGINTPFNDDFPFLHPDGQTFYFSSEGHNSMGGYDVFRSIYNELNDSFSPPENLDFAVNSPDDDMLYVTDKNNQRAYFASSRSSGQGRMHVYQVRVTANPLQLVLLKGTFIPEKAGVGKYAQISVVDAATNALVGEYETNPQTGAYVIDLPRSGKYKFTLDAEGSSLAHHGVVEVPARDEVVAYAQEISLVEVGNTEKLIIKNSFDQPLSEDIYALAQQVLKARAGLQVNYDPAEEPVAAKPSSFADLSAAYQEAGFSQGFSNELVLENAEKRHAELGKKSTTIRQQSDYAFTMAEKKREQSAKAMRDAEDLLRLADAVGEGDESSKYLMQAMASKFAAEKLAEEALVAVRLAKQLNARLADVEHEEQRALLLTEDLQSALQSEEYNEVVEALKAVKESDEKGGGISAHRADEFQLLREMAQNRRKEADVAAKIAQDLREEEGALTMRIKNRKLQLESAKTKDKPGIQREIDVLEDDLGEVEAQIESLFSDLETSQRDAERMVQQAALFQKIDNNQTDTYIPKEQVQSYSADNAGTIEQRAESVKVEMQGMEFSMSAVRAIIESETNVAFDAFANRAEFDAFVQQYDLPKPQEKTPGGTQTAKVADPEEIRDRIAAARDWIAIVDESVADLQAQRENLPAGAERDEVDRKLEEFQQLKYKKVREIEDSKVALRDVDAREADELTSLTESRPKPAETSSERAGRPSLTGIQRDPLLTKVYPEYETRLADLESKDVGNTESIRQKTALDREMIALFDEEIERIEAKPESARTAEEKNDLEVMRQYRRQMAEDVAFNEDFLAAENGDRPPKTSTEILLEASSRGSEREAVQVAPQTAPAVYVATTGDIPESIGYADIDPEYEQQLERIQRSGDSEVQQRELEIDVHRGLIENIDKQLVQLDELAATASPEEKLRTERAISQLNQIRTLKQNEIETTAQEVRELRVAEFAETYAVIVDEVDSEYVSSYTTIDQSNESDYLKAFNKARLEQRTVEQIDQRIVELVQDMDNAPTVAEQQRKQETIQQLQLVKQEKVVAYESLFAQADRLTPSSPAGQTSTDSLVEDTPQTEAASADVSETESLSTEEIAGLSETPVPTGRPDSDTPRETPDIAGETDNEVSELPAAQVKPVVSTPSTQEKSDQLTYFVQNEFYNLGNLGEYTVFGEISDMNYKSLNASLDIEAIGGELQRHRENVTAFVREYASNDLDAAGKEQVEILLQNEIALQTRITESNRRELDYYETGNAELLDAVFAKPPKNLTDESRFAARDAITEARQLRNEATSLRNEARKSTDAGARLMKQKAAFDLEVQAIEKMGRANRALTAWKQGKSQPWEDPSFTAIPVAVSSVSIPDIMANERAARIALAETAPVEPAEEPSTEIAETARPDRVTPAAAISAGLSPDVIAHFNLNTQQIERIESQPVYRDWFREQWKADSLDVLRVSRFTEAEKLLNDAEAILQESDELADQADAETDPVAQESAYNRSGELQNEARELFEMARRLREEMAQYGQDVETARQQAAELLRNVSADEAEELNALAAAAPVQRAAPVAETPRTPPAAVKAEPVVTPPAATTPPVTPTPVQVVEEPEEETVAEVLPATATPGPEERVERAVPAFPEMEFAADIEEIFETNVDVIYTAANPIPVGIQWPDGLVFAVQVGAFRNPIPQDHFRGFTPIRGEVVRDGITRYSAGMFTAFDRANSAKNEIRGMGYSDAFVVAYLNGERIALNRALSEADAAAIIADAGTARTTPTTTPPTTTPATSTPTTPAQTDQRTADTPPTTSPGTTTTGGTPIPVVREDFVPDPSATAYYNDPEAAPAVQVERVRGLFFTVQVGVYSRPVSAASLNNITPLNSEQTATGNIRYTSGMFPDLDFAQGHRQVVINAGVNDAFVTAYYNGERISVAQARALLDERGESVLAGSRAPAESQPATPTEAEERTDTPPATSLQSTPQAASSEPGDAAYADAADFEAEDIRYVLDLGAYGSGMPQQTADAILQFPDAGVSRLQLPDGRTHYLSKPLARYTEAESMRLRFYEAGVENAQVRAMALGFLVKLEDARRITGE